MYTATITKTNFSGGTLQIEVEYTNGTETLLEAYNVTSQADVDRAIARKLAQLADLEQTAATIVVGEYTPPATTPAPTPEPTAEEIARGIWLEKWNDYKLAQRAMQELEKAGIAPTVEEQTAFDALKTWVGENRRKEYMYFI